MPAWHLPRKLVRLVRYVILSALVCTLVGYSRRVCLSSSNSSTLSRSRRNAVQSPTAVDFAWGSILHRFQNHPRPPRKREPFPWQAEPSPVAGAAAAAGKQGDQDGAAAPIRVLIVTSELAGLHTNGGIGTAFSELAQTLAAAGNGREFVTTILVTHLADSFPFKKRENVTNEYAAKHVRLQFVEQEPQPFWPQAWTPTASMRVWRWLRARDGQFDVVHFPDNTGIGYFATLGKYQGLALEHTRVVVGLHGADVEWAAMLNKRYPTDRYAVELGVFERRTAEMADAVVAPSEYMLEYVRSRGWAVPPQSAFVIPNIVQLPPVPPTRTRTPAQVKYGAASDMIIRPITELVFFGRLEERKGTRMLVHALEDLYADPATAARMAGIQKITFLGRDQPDTRTRSQMSHLIAGGLDGIKAHGANATFEYQFLTTLDRDAALAYLQPPHRLALLPSLADNSPSTVLECIAYGIRFVTSNVGGIPELVHPDDRAQVIVSPLAKTFAKDLVKVMDRLATSPWKPVRAAPETQTAAKDWIQFHHWLVETAPPPPPPPPSTANVAPPRRRWRGQPLVSVCITHFERSHLLPQLLDSLLLQTETDFEVILIDDGSPTEQTRIALDELDSRYFRGGGDTRIRDWTFLRTDNAYLGEARNRAARRARGDWLLFLDDDDVLKPHALETLLRVARKTGASALSTWLDEFASDADPLAEKYTNGTIELPHRRTYWFLGQELSAGLVANSFGSGNIFVTHEAFARVGGFSTYRDVGGEDWEFWTKLALTIGTGAEEKHLVVPEELIFARSDPARDSMKFSMDPWDAHFRSTVPVLNDPRIQDLNLAHGLMLLKSAVTRPYATPPFADSTADFQLTQDWNGWTYSFQRLPADPSELAEWAPSTGSDQLGIVSPDAPEFIMDLHHLRKPFIDDSTQAGMISRRGERFAAIRSFKAPRTLHVAVDLTYRSEHACGDGTRLSLIQTGASGERPETLVEYMTMEEGFAEFVGAATLRAGNSLHVVSDPLGDDECDRVEVHLRVTRIEVENQSWSRLARRASLAANEERRQSAQEDQPVETNSTWTLVPVERPSEDSMFNIALIFDRNRFPHAMSVIRSIQHFSAGSRKLVFHLIATMDTRDELTEYFADTDMTLKLYDHGLCAYVAKAVLPFSDPEIHVSAHCKMFLTEIIKDAERVLYLDTDTTVLSDLSACYDRPTDNPAALVSMAVDMGDACQNNPNACWPIGMHWRVPPGLECGNVPARHGQSRHTPESCAEEGELETLQVNGGVALFELARMRDAGFLERYVQSIVHHYQLMRNAPARWGEQDFINSFFRLYPDDLEFLPCGCNYQWFGARREVKCGAQPVHIAHHWAHGIAARTKEPYNVLFHHFADDRAGAPLPPVPELSASLPGAPNTSTIQVVNTRNCPRQDHDCSHAFAPSEFGTPVVVVSRILSETFAADLVDSLESQTYPKVAHVVAKRSEVTIPTSTFERGEVVLGSDPEAQYDVVCAACGTLAMSNASCTTPPTTPRDRKRYFDCVCDVPDATTASLVELDALAARREEQSWILHLDDTQLFADSASLSHLMARVDSTQDLILFRTNTSSREQEYAYRKKILPRSALDGVGFLFHSSHLDLAKWDASTGCARWRLLNRLSSRLRVKWIDTVPIIEHPLQRHLPATAPDDFKVSLIILETRGRRSWTNELLLSLQIPEFDPLVAEIIVASIDSPEGTYGDDVFVTNLTPGSGMGELGALAASEKVLLLSDSVALDKTALTALINFHLDEPPNRLVGLFSETENAGDFSPPLPTTAETFDVFAEPDALVGGSTWSHLLPRTLLIARSTLEELAAVLDDHDTAGGDNEPLHPVCHPILLSALSVRASGGLPPLRILPPRKSVTDRVHDCRQRGWPNVTYGVTAGDWVFAGGEGMLLSRDGDQDADEAESQDLVEAAVRAERSSSDLDPDLGGDGAGTIIGAGDDDDNDDRPTLEACIAAIGDLLGSAAADEWIVFGDQVGVAGAQGMKVGIEKASEIEPSRWEEARSMGRCYLT
ncbi:Proteophosphoglycan ppg4 [Rhodotorula sp. JG-1b]|nr:Proteophosphoglycan ppg4 [Rhodotorula sp. JG-1b]